MWNVNGTANEDQIKNKNVSEVGAEKEEEEKAPLGGIGECHHFFSIVFSLPSSSFSFGARENHVRSMFVCLLAWVPAGGSLSVTVRAFVNS